MSANLATYTMLFIAADGTLLAEEQELTITRTVHSKPIETIHCGYAGEVPGSPMIEFSVKSAVPSAGFELDMGKKMNGMIPFEFQVFGPGGSSAKGKAWVLTDTIKHGVHSPSAYSFHARAKLALFQ